MLLVVVGLLGVVRPSDRPAALAAMFNCAVALALCYRFLTINSILGMLPSFFIIPITVLTSVSSLYFCVFSPDVFVRPYDTQFRLLDSNARFQAATLVGMLAFSIPWLLFESRERLPMTYAAFLEHSRQMAVPVFLFFFTFIVVLLSLRLVHIGPSTTVGYLVYGLYRYGNGLPFLAGAAWRELRKRTKTIIILLLAVNFVFNTFTNARAYAFLPLVYFGFGLLFLSRIPTRSKLRSLVLLVVLVGVALVVGNAGRRLGLGLWYGGAEELQRRLEVLSQKTDKLVNERWADDIFTRLFFTGGHQIVMLMPEVYEYKPVSLVYYLAEVASQGLLPRRIANALVPPFYEDKSSLVAIGHRITESHSVERSFIGAAWEMGGFLFVFIVGMLTGLFTLAIAQCVVVLFRMSGNLGVVVFAVVADQVFFSMNEGLPSIAHELIYSLVIGTFLYFVILFLQYLSPRPVRRRLAL